MKRPPADMTVSIHSASLRNTAFQTRENVPAEAPARSLAVPFGPGVARSDPTQLQGLNAPRPTSAADFVRRQREMRESAQGLEDMLIGSQLMLLDALAQLSDFASRGAPTWEEEFLFPDPDDHANPEAVNRIDDIARTLSPARLSENNPSRTLATAQTAVMTLEVTLFSTLEEAQSLGALTPDMGLPMKTLDMLRAYPAQLEALKGSIQAFEDRYAPQV